MENKSSKKIKILMVVILLLFLIPSGIDFVDGFSEGWKFTEREEELTGQDDDHYQSFFVRLEPTGRDYPAKEVGYEHRFVSFRESGQLVMAERMNSVWWVMALRVLLALTILVSLVAFIVMLFRFAAKITRRQIMAGENIRSLRRIAYTLGALSLAGYLMEVVEILWLRSHISLDGYKVVMAMPPAALIVSLILLVMTEILKIGNKLQQEQELTI